MPLKRVVNAVELLAVLAAAVFVVMLFANEPGGNGGNAKLSPGARIFLANCAGCHGADGGGGVGPKLAGVVKKDFPDIADQIAVVRDGRSAMPSFGGDLTDQELEEVVQYTRTDLGR